MSVTVDQKEMSLASLHATSFQILLEKFFWAEKWPEKECLCRFQWHLLLLSFDYLSFPPFARRVKNRSVWGFEIGKNESKQIRPQLLRKIPGGI